MRCWVRRILFVEWREVEEEKSSKTCQGRGRSVEFRRRGREETHPTQNRRTKLAHSKVELEQIGEGEEADGEVFLLCNRVQVNQGGGRKGEKSAPSSVTLCGRSSSSSSR